MIIDGVGQSLEKHKGSHMTAIVIWGMGGNVLKRILSLITLVYQFNLGEELRKLVVSILKH